MADSDDEWPNQNDARIVPKIEKILRTRFGLRPLREEPLDIRQSGCDVFQQCRGQSSSQFQTCYRTLPQRVAHAIIRPETGYNMMANHNVGTGKTCLALGAAYNYAVEGRYVWWVTRYNLISSVKADMQRSCCFDSVPPSGNVEQRAEVSEMMYFYSYKRFVNYIWPPEKLRQWLNKSEIARAKPIRERPGYPTQAVRDERRAISSGSGSGGSGWEMDDILSGQLLIIDEPQLLWEVKGGEGDPDMFNVVRALVEYSYYRAAKDPEHEPVTVLLLTATPGGSGDSSGPSVARAAASPSASPSVSPSAPVREKPTTQLERAALLVNLLIRDPRSRLDVKNLASILRSTKKNREGVLDQLRGYISFFDGANNITRFAEIERRSVVVSGGGEDDVEEDDEGNFGQDEESDGEEVEDEEEELLDADADMDLGESEDDDDDEEEGGVGVRRANPKKRREEAPVGQRTEALAETDYDGALQLICNKKLEVPKDDERKKLAQCYLNNSGLAVSGRRYLPEALRDYNLVTNDERDQFLDLVNSKGPKLAKLYAVATTEERGGKQFIISNASTNTTVGAVASVFRAHGHSRVIFDVDSTGKKIVFKEMLPDGSVRVISERTPVGSKGRYLLLTRAAVLYPGGKTERDIVKRFRDQIFSFINRRGEDGSNNVDGGQVQYVIADRTYREGVSFFDMKAAHLIEPMTKSEETQAVGRVRRMCGQCALPYKDGWQIRVYVYDVEADRLPWFDVHKRDLPPEFFSTGAERVSRAKPSSIASFRVECVGSRGCGEYGVKIVEMLESKATEQFLDLLREAAIDRGFYEIAPVEKLRAEAAARRTIEAANMRLRKAIRARLLAERRTIRARRAELIDQMVNKEIFFNPCEEVALGPLVKRVGTEKVTSLAHPSFVKLPDGSYLLAYEAHFKNGYFQTTFARFDRQWRVTKVYSERMYSGMRNLTLYREDGTLRALFTGMDGKSRRAYVSIRGDVGNVREVCEGRKINADASGVFDEGQLAVLSVQPWRVMSFPGCTIKESEQPFTQLVEMYGSSRVSFSHAFTNLVPWGERQWLGVVNVQYQRSRGQPPGADTPLGGFVRKHLVGEPTASFFAFCIVEPPALIVQQYSHFFYTQTAPDIQVTSLRWRGEKELEMAYSARRGKLFVQRVPSSRVASVLFGAAREAADVYFTRWRVAARRLIQLPTRTAPKVPAELKAPPVPSSESPVSAQAAPVQASPAVSVSSDENASPIVSKIPAPKPRKQKRAPVAKKAEKTFLNLIKL